MCMLRHEARILALRGIRPVLTILSYSLGGFHRRLITLSGWKDGWRGLHLACLLAWYYGLQPYWLLLKGAAGKVK